ncbi:MAG: ComEC/Rec2 family competence protein [Nocardioides sp.]
MSTRAVSTGGESSRPPDLRTVWLACFAWAGALAGAGLGWVGAVLVGVLFVVGGAVLARRRGRGTGLAVVAAVVLYAAVAFVSGVHHEQVTHNPLTRLADERAAVTVTGVVSSDPRRIQGRFGVEVLVRLTTREVLARGHVLRLRQPMLVLGRRLEWQSVPLGATVRVSGHVASASGGDVAAMLSSEELPDIRAGPDPWWTASGCVRAALRESVAGLPSNRRVLVPALVDGDDTDLDPELVEDFRRTGLTHLLAVSGTNLTLVVGFAVTVARWLRVRGRWLYAVGALGILGFVLLARTEPSVLRAAAMGIVALVGMAEGGADRGTRALGVALVALLLLDPALATSVGFALSVLATAGILLLAPSWRSAMGRWMPRWLAEAVAVPAAAQLACTPLVAAISGQVSLVAVVANLAAAPVVGPATVLGLAGGLTTLVWPAGGRVLGWAAGWCVAWLVAVAERAAGLPSAAVSWSTGPLALAVLTIGCVVVAVGAPRLLRHRSTGLACCGLLVAAVLVRLPTPGWPPGGWVMVACDVGQGDGLVLNTGIAHTAVVVDAGPDPRPMKACLDALAVRSVPLVVLTHFHADHVDGFPGVLAGRRVGQVWVSRLQDPPDGVSSVEHAAAGAGVPTTVAPYSEPRRVGDLTLEALWPLPDSPSAGPGDGSTANNASVVLLARVRGVTLLLTGDIEPEGQQRLAATLPGLRVDVLKVPHHGSRYQDLPFLQSLHARLALVSVGSDNDYGQPAPETVSGLAATGARVLRTDLTGTIAVVEQDGRLSAVTLGH